MNSFFPESGRPESGLPESALPESGLPESGQASAAAGPSDRHEPRYRHESLLYAGREDLLSRTVPFVKDAIAAGEPILVVQTADKLAALGAALGADAARVTFADMADVGINPARIIPAWREFLGKSARAGRRVRGIGEPIWAERSAPELDECQRHEALLNAAFAGEDLWLICPYDTTSLPPEVLDTAVRNHRFVCAGGSSGESGTFPGDDALARPFEGELPAPPARAVEMDFDRTNLGQLRRLVVACARAASFTGGRVLEIVTAVNEVATNSLIHGGGHGRLRMWSEGGNLLCEVRDLGELRDPLAGRVLAGSLQESGRGLWLVNQICELVQIRSGAAGTAVRLHVRKPAVA